MNQKPERISKPAVAQAMSSVAPGGAAKVARVVIVEDHESIRSMLDIVLRMEGGFEVVGEPSGGIEGLRVCRATQPDVVILDLALPELCGVHLIRILKAELWDARILVYTGTMDPEMMRAALAEEPHGFVRKEDSLQELKSALRAVLAGGRHVSPYTQRLRGDARDPRRERLSPDELAVLQMVSEGRQNKEMAEVLGTTSKQIDHHRQRIMGKLRLHDVASLTRFALRNQLYQG